MDLFYIIESICEHIHDRFDKTNIYVNDVPQGFSRPSFYVGLVDFVDTDFNLGTMDRRATFEVIYFAPLNSRGLTDKIKQHLVYMNMASIFSEHSLAVKDRYIKIVSKNGNLTDSEAHLTINFEYSIDNNVNEDDLYELMNQLQSKYVYNI